MKLVAICSLSLSPTIHFSFLNNLYNPTTPLGRRARHFSLPPPYFGRYTFNSFIFLKIPYRSSPQPFHVARFASLARTPGGLTGHAVADAGRAKRHTLRCDRVPERRVFSKNERAQCVGQGFQLAVTLRSPSSLTPSPSAAPVSNEHQR